MITYKSEAEVEKIIKDKLLTAGCKSDVNFFNDSMGDNTVIRIATFKVVVEMKGSSAIIDKVSDLTLETNKGVFYKGSEATARDNMELRHLFFQANIKPD